MATVLRLRSSSRVDYLGWLFISTRGRIPRSTYWAAKLGLLFTLVVVLATSVAVARTNSRGDPPGWVWLPLIPYLFAIVAVAIKRLHDRDMSGWWVLVCFVPYLGELFSLIVLGCLKGTEGSNDYGPDPLKPEAAET
jgi:uncharacterized membrane protein YhaH (DUF805 family)